MLELLIVITNIGLILVSLALTIVTGLDNQALIRTIRIISTQRKTRKGSRRSRQIKRHGAYTPRHSA